MLETDHKSLWQHAFAGVGQVGRQVLLSGTTDTGGWPSSLAQRGALVWGEWLHTSGKRRFDIIVSLLLLVLASPVMLTVMLAIWLGSLGQHPVIYRQVRVGLNGRRFSLLKFRSMRVDAERDGIRMAVVNDPRITRIGKLIRKTRIDELPQLLNVLRGDMSLVGPRPERPEFVAQYAGEIEGYALRHLVKPGITGMAQVRHGYAEGLEGAVLKLYHDLDYIRRCSMRTDFVILLRTFPVVMTGWGAR